MGLEGLDFILQKREVVPTVSARDLLERTEQVEDDYRRHVRTYVPISRSAAGNGDQLSVEKFEQKVIQQVVGARAPRGYLTAEYGYGKTSTALYLWDRAEQAGLVVVPPFQMLELPNLIDATHGWVRHRLLATRRDLVDQLDALYHQTTAQSIENAVKQSGGNEVTIRQWVREGRLTLDLQTADYLHYFEDVTALVQQAGYKGLIVLPDEIQQYIELKMRSGAGDPIVPFFNLMQGLATREGRLCFGFIMVIPRKEIGIIQDSRGRGDLLQRMREVSLDLSSVYDQDFAARLWQRLAEVFQFQDVANDIVKPETLVALGQIAARGDLSNGPRTVINTFRRMVERYKDQGHSHSQPYSPIDLVDDLLSGAIQFTGNDQIQNVTRRALQSAVVRGNAERVTAVKLAAAFPNDGTPRQLQKQYQVEAAFDELHRIALGDLIIAVGPIEQGGFTLAGLDQVNLTVDWLPQTIRDFRRSYSETLNDTRERALEVFAHLLKDRMFRNWKVIEEKPGTFTADRSLVFQGDFQSFATRYPKRQVCVKIFWEGEKRKEDDLRDDAIVEYHLGIHLDDEDWQSRSTPLTFDFERGRAIIPINLMYLRPEGIAPQIQQQLQGVWSPYELTPLVLMNIYQMLEEKRVAGVIPKRDDEFIRNGFQPDLLDEIQRGLFNAVVGEPVNATGPRIMEEVVGRLLESRFGQVYKTLMPVTTWRDSLRKYFAALDRLESIYEKRGEVEYEGTKTQIAELFTLSNPGLESLMKSFPMLIELVRDWPTQREEKQGATGAIKFTLHPHERTILDWLYASPDKEKVIVGGKAHEVHTLKAGEVVDRSLELGYQSDETDQLIELLIKRGYIEIHRKWLLRETPADSPDSEGLIRQLSELQSFVSILRKGFSESGRLPEIQNRAEKWSKQVEQELQSGKPDPQLFLKMSRGALGMQADLRHFAADKQKELSRRLTTMLTAVQPLRQDYLTTLERPIEGSVSYVDQVNVLRNVLVKQSQSVISKIAQLRSNLEQSQKTVGRQELAPEDLIEQEHRLARYESSMRDVQSQQTEFESFYQHLNGWRRLVTEGSNLQSQLQEMESVAQGLHEPFDRLAREVRADISSQPNKTSLLPNYSIYESRLSELVTQVRAIRDRALDDFADRQNRYRTALTVSNLYPREEMDRPFEFNFSNPGESYRLLEEYIQTKIIDLVDHMQRRVLNRHQGVQQTLDTPFLGELPEEERARIKRQGQESQQQLDQLMNAIDIIKQQVQDVTVIRDFPSSDAGRFAAVVGELSTIRDRLRDSEQQMRQLDSWLREFKLSPAEDQTLQRLSVSDPEALEDLVMWRKAASLNDDEFWWIVRTLYDKRRIRILIGRVRS